MGPGYQRKFCHLRVQKLLPCMYVPPSSYVLAIVLTDIPALASIDRPPCNAATPPKYSRDFRYALELDVQAPSIAYHLTTTGLRTHARTLRCHTRSSRAETFAHRVAEQMPFLR